MQVDITRKETVLVQQQRAIDVYMLTVKLVAIVIQRCHDKLKTVYSTNTIFDDRSDSVTDNNPM